MTPLATKTPDGRDARPAHPRMSDHRPRRERLPSQSSAVRVAPESYARGLTLVRTVGRRGTEAACAIGSLSSPYAFFERHRPREQTLMRLRLTTVPARAHYPRWRWRLFFLAAGSGA